MTATVKINETKKGRQASGTATRRRAARAHGGSKRLGRTQRSIAKVTHATVGRGSGASRERTAFDALVRRSNQSWFDAGTGAASVHLTLNSLQVGAEFLESLNHNHSVLKARATLSSIAEGKGNLYLALVDSELMAEQELEELLSDVSIAGSQKLETEVVRRLHEQAQTLIRQLGFEPEQAKSRSYSGTRTHIYVRESVLGAEIAGGRLFDVSGLDRLRPEIGAYVGRALKVSLYTTACSTPYDNFTYQVDAYSAASMYSIVKNFVTAGRSNAARDIGWEELCADSDGEDHEGDYFIFGLGYKSDFDRALKCLADSYEHLSKVPGWHSEKKSPKPDTQTPKEVKLVDWATRVLALRPKLRRRGMTFNFEWDDHRCFHEGNLLGFGRSDERLMDLFYEAINDGSGEYPGMVLNLKTDSHRVREFIVAACLTECVIGELEGLLHPNKKKAGST